VAQFADPPVATIGQGLVGPSGLVSDAMIETAQRCKVGYGSLVPLPTRGSGDRGHNRRPACDIPEHTGRVEGFDHTAIVGDRSTPGGSGVEGLSGLGVGNRIAPFGL
jgi:hypothetical protein